MNYGYVRVSTTGQNVDRQIEAMKKLEQDEGEIILFVEKVSGKNFERREYKKMLKALQPGDTIYVKSIDRFGRNYDEIIEQWKDITQYRQANIVVIDVPLLDTRNKNDLTGKVISDIFLQLMSYLAQSEREKLKTRQQEGIAIAKAKGVKFGPPCKVSAKAFEKYYAEVQKGKLDEKAVCIQLGISKNTYYNYVKKYIKNK